MDWKAFLKTAAIVVVTMSLTARFAATRAFTGQVPPTPGA